MRRSHTDEGDPPPLSAIGRSAAVPNLSADLDDRAVSSCPRMDIDVGVPCAEVRINQSIAGPSTTSIATPPGLSPRPPAQPAEIQRPVSGPEVEMGERSVDASGADLSMATLHPENSMDQDAGVPLSQLRRSRPNAEMVSNSDAD